MNRIWANRLEARDRTWNEVPASRQEAVKEILYADMEKGKISQEEFNEILNIE